jgi:hypothetical protein
MRILSKDMRIFSKDMRILSKDMRIFSKVPLIFRQDAPNLRLEKRVERFDSGANALAFRRLQNARNTQLLATLSS